MQGNRGLIGMLQTKVMDMNYALTAIDVAAMALPDLL